MNQPLLYMVALFAALIYLLSMCRQPGTRPSAALIKAMNLKRGEVISCRPADKEFGVIALEYGGAPEVKENLSVAVKLLHSFEYDEAEKVFASIIDEHPDCALAYWGVAMANFHPLWAPPGEQELRKGAKAIEIGLSIGQKSPKEAGYLEAIAAFYHDWNLVDHRTRTTRFEKAMAALWKKYPDDKEVAVFYALALTAAADPGDKTYQKQKMAGTLLNTLYPDQPDHPGIVHYLIHAYDYPELADLGLPAARKYASVAPSSAHALHMPSHIFTRLGLWEESIQSNRASVLQAQCYALQAGIKGHWDEEVHGLDYLVYAYLQKGMTDSAERQWQYLISLKEVSPPNFKVAYALAAIPVRMVLENRRWKEAASLQLPPSNVPWDNFPWQKAMLHFARLMGAVHTGDKQRAGREYKELTALHQKLLQEKNSYQADKVQVQRLAGNAWMLLMEGKKGEALEQMQLASELEDQSEKHPVTPGDVLPAGELLGDLLLQLNRPAQALDVYEESLKKHPNRFNGLYGAGRAAQLSGNEGKARAYYLQLLKTAGKSSSRHEWLEAKQFLNKQKSTGFSSFFETHNGN